MTTKITTLRLGTMSNFIYIIADDATKDAMVVDPAWDMDAIEKVLTDNDYQLTGILLTHSHGDHISALLDMVKKYKVPTYITRLEFRLGRARVTKPHYIEDGDTIALGNRTITVIETPGHTVGGVCYHIDNHLIAGDTLFIDGCGRCDFYESDAGAMWESLQKIKQLPDETIIHPGHDYGQKDTDTLGNQKQTNPYLLIDDKDFFVDFRLNLQSAYRSIPFAPSSKKEMQAIYQKHAK